MVHSDETNVKCAVIVVTMERGRVAAVVIVGQLVRTREAGVNRIELITIFIKIFFYLNVK